MVELMALAALLCRAEPPAEPRSIRATVIHCDTADTVVVRPEGGRDEITVRLIGLDAPVKASRDADGQEPWGTRAQQWLALKLTRKSVTVEFDVLVREQGQDSLWGYLWLGDELINAELLKEGHAELATRPPNVKHVERLTAAQSAAREAGRGIWDPAEPLPEPAARYRAAAAGRERERAEAIAALELSSWRAGCVVGNRTSRKYHVEGMRDYERAKTSRHAVFFADEATARRAGFERAAR